MAAAFHGPCCAAAIFRLPDASRESALPRFFFDVETTTGVIRDQVGMNLPDTPAMIFEVIYLLNYLANVTPANKRYGIAKVMVRSEADIYVYDAVVHLGPV